MDLQAGSGRRRSYQLHNCLIAGQRFASPVLADTGKEPVFYLVPLAGAGRKMTDLDRQSRLVRQRLQLPFPETAVIAVRATAVGHDLDVSGVGVRFPSPLRPP